ncbi:MAG TPA: hypothetical protein VFE21_10590 [Rubrobacteraceae bacterium]|nr:hypothetical protein [Rubrobacteraceae bacterium]
MRYRCTETRQRQDTARADGRLLDEKGDIEVGPVGINKEARPERIDFVGSIKRRERVAFNRRDLGYLVLPGAWG